MKQAIITVKDEVNCKITGLDLDTRKKLVNKLKYMVPHARYLPSFKLGRWDGKIAFFQLGGSTYINLLPIILPILDSDGYDIELNDTREYQTSFQFNEVDENSYQHITWPEKHQCANQPIQLRDYQVETVNAFLKNPQCLQEIATGAGKTLMTASLSERVGQYGRSIVVVPNKSLVVQTEEDYLNMQLDVGVFYGDRKEYDKQHTICTWQSLNSLLKRTKNQEADITIHEFLEGVVCVIIDECHGIKADALKGLLTGVMAHIPLRWGFTGTIPKEDFEFKALEVSIGPVINKISAYDLQNQGVLAKCHVNIVQLKDLVEHTNYQSELKYLLSDEKRLDVMAKLITKAKQGGNTLVLVDRINAGKELVDRLDNAVFVSGATKGKDRQEHYDEVADTDDKIIIATYGVAAVGINIPRIFNLVLIEPGKSFVRVIQSIGRGVRKAEDKDFVQIWDITSTCKFAKRHLTKRKSFYREAGYPYAIEKLDWK